MSATDGYLALDSARETAVICRLVFSSCGRTPSPTPPLPPTTATVVIGAMVVLLNLRSIWVFEKNSNGRPLRVEKAGD